MLRKILPYLRPYRLPFLFALTQVFLMSACEILKPWPLKIVIDNPGKKNACSPEMRMDLALALTLLDVDP